MKRMMIIATAILSCYGFLAHPGVMAQNNSRRDYPKVEAASVYNLIVTEYGSIHGGGARLTVNPHRNLGVEAELAGIGGGGLGLFGLKVTHRMGPVAVFGKVRPGLFFLDPVFATDFGGGIEVSFQKHVGVRFDFGDLMTFEDGRREHYFLFGSGLVIRF
jgi:hypothetical protein